MTEQVVNLLEIVKIYVEEKFLFFSFFDLEKYIEKYKIESYLNIPDNILQPYAVLDPIVTYRTYKLGLELSKLQPKVYQCYKDYIMPSTEVFQEMEIEGMEINTEYLNKINKQLVEDGNKLAEEIQKDFGEKFDVNSPQQLAKIIEKNKWPSHGKGKEGYYSVGDQQLKKWK